MDEKKGKKVYIKIIFTSFITVVVVLFFVIGFLSYQRLNPDKAEGIALDHLEEKYGTRDFVLIDFEKDPLWLNVSVRMAPKCEPYVSFSVDCKRSK